MRVIGQIPEDEELWEYSGNTNGDISRFLNKLKDYGVTLITDIGFGGSGSSAVSIKRSTQTVNGSTCTGLTWTSTSNNVFFQQKCSLPDLTISAVQMGFRLTLSAGQKTAAACAIIRILSPAGSGVKSFTIPTDEQASTYYYELLAAVVSGNTSRIKFTLYCNKKEVDSYETNISSTGSNPVVVIDSNGLFSQSANKTVMIGDMYCMSVPYEGNANPSLPLLGSIKVNYSPVTAFSGAGATNSLGKDIVEGLNSSDSSAGYLLLPSSGEAQITFDKIDNSNGNVVAVVAVISHFPMDASNNQLEWEVKSGENGGGVVVPDDPGNVASWTVSTQGFVTVPGTDTSFPSNEMDFTAKLYNRVTGSN
ncbi:hypothetical protein G5G67_003591 [Escherichia coli]|nr:hypothetical protein [Escherichia coli]